MQTQRYCKRRHKSWSAHRILIPLWSSQWNMKRQLLKLKNLCNKRGQTWKLSFFFLFSFTITKKAEGNSTENFFVFFQDLSTRDLDRRNKFWIQILSLLLLLLKYIYPSFSARYNPLCLLFHLSLKLWDPESGMDILHCVFFLYPSDGNSAYLKVTFPLSYCFLE